MASAANPDLERAASEISEILDQAGIYVEVTVRDGILYLEGEVDSEANRQAALDIAAAVARPIDAGVQDALDVVALEEDFPPDETVADPDAAGFIDRDVGIDPGEYNEDAAAGGVPYFPPTDPVVEPSGDVEQLAVVGGFQSTSMEDDPTDPARGAPPDGWLEDMVIRELREDALTTDLGIEVEVANGVVTLRGTVPTLDDAVNAEAVAGRIEGVVEVVEELNVETGNR
jgi:osmotically-inducible protein OsmY